MSTIKVGRRNSKNEPYWETLVEKTLSSQNEMRHRGIYASTSALCERQTAGLMKIPPGRKDIMRATSQFYFKQGLAFETVMKKAFEKKGILIDDEVRVEYFHDKLPVSGRIDFVIEDPRDSEYVLVELKSCGKLPPNIKPAHKAQLMNYLCMTGMKRGIVWYVSRNVMKDFQSGDVAQKAFVLEPTDEERQETIRTVALGALYAETPYLPEIPPTMKKYRCGFCKLVPYCWEGDDMGLSVTPMPDAATAKELSQEAQQIVDEVMDQQEALRIAFEADV